ncbi:MAG: hypothetical protein M9904_14500 [Chitinophagaceae bacterium]|nr:hypothetical protein [Chitinophagaceae bacterium]MCO5241257.1 hypothetical protein [Chitinophagaceae bacterium]
MNNTIPNKGEAIRGYYRLSKAYFATETDVERSTLMVGVYYDDGSTAGEVSVEWETTRGQKVPVLTAYDDSWKTLSRFGDLIKEMAEWNNKNITEEQFTQLLNKKGFTDLTPYRPKLTPVKHSRTVRSSYNKGLKK